MHFNPVFSFSAPLLVPTFSNSYCSYIFPRKGGEPWGLKCKHSNCTWPSGLPLGKYPETLTGLCLHSAQLLKLDASTSSSGSKRKMTESEMCKQDACRPSPSSQKEKYNREKTALNGRLPRHRDSHPPANLGPYPSPSDLAPDRISTQSMLLTRKKGKL